MNYRRQSPSFKYAQTSHQLTHSLICSLVFVSHLFFHDMKRTNLGGKADCPDCPTFKKQTNCVFRQPLRLWGHYYYYFFWLNEWVRVSWEFICIPERTFIATIIHLQKKNKAKGLMLHFTCLFFFSSFFVISKLSSENPGACARVQDRPRPPGAYGASSGCCSVPRFPP